MPRTTEERKTRFTNSVHVLLLNIWKVGVYRAGVTDAHDVCCHLEGEGQTPHGVQHTGQEL